MLLGESVGEAVGIPVAERLSRGPPKSMAADGMFSVPRIAVIIGLDVDGLHGARLIPEGGIVERP